MAGMNTTSVNTINTEDTTTKRQAYIRAKNGDYIGNNWVVPKGDFSHFLGYKAPTEAELTGKQQVSGSRVIELALQAEMKEIGEGAAKRGNEYRNMYVAPGRFENEPGRERDMMKDGLDAIQQGP